MSDNTIPVAPIHKYTSADESDIHTMFKTKRTIVTELGNSIDFSVELYADNPIFDSVRVFARGPKSETDHVWTRIEAETLFTCLSIVLNKPYAV